jgi:hypothetical protein
MKLKSIAYVFLFLLFTIESYSQNTTPIAEYMDVLKERGEEPVAFVNKVLKDYDLIVFDDALHLAQEPFDFYQKLIRDEAFRKNVKYVFIEVLATTSQPYIDAYLNNPQKDKTILLPAFQNDYSGVGWRYQTYLDLLETIWEINSKSTESEKIHVVCMDQAIYWEGIHSQMEYDLFQESLITRDYLFYKIITQTLDSFKSGDKGVFLTNTRHAYKHIRNSNNALYWNAATFLNQWHPGKSYSIRFHNINLSIQPKLENNKKYTQSWIKMENGLWDEAFKENQNVPVAFSLKDNIFGRAKYIGNHMQDVATNQTMYDAYDALIFLAPLEKLHFSAKFDFIYTDAFKKELKRRITLLQGKQLPKFLKRNNVKSVDNYIEELVQFQEAKKNSLVPSEKN